MNTKITNAYILLGGKEPTMDKTFQETMSLCSSETNPLVLITGLPHEVKYYEEKVKSSGIVMRAHSSDKAYDTFTNFSKDIGALLKEVGITDLNLIILANPSQAYRVNKIMKYMIRYNKAFKTCSFDVISSNEIPHHGMEFIANIFYRFGYVGMWMSRTLALYRTW